MLKLYGKLGLSKTVTSYSKNMQVRPDVDIYNQPNDLTRLGARRFDAVSNYGQGELLDELVIEYN